MLKMEYIITDRGQRTLYNLYSWRFVIGPVASESPIHINMLDKVPKPVNIAGTKHDNQSNAP